jgi:hypothetical protein
MERSEEEQEEKGQKTEQDRSDQFTDSQLWSLALFAFRKPPT